MKTLLRLTCLSALVLAGACSESATGGSQSVRELGYIQYTELPVEITIPTTVRAGEAFTVRVTTRGDGCVTADDTEVVTVGTTTTVAPYDLRTTTPDQGCTRELRSFVHTASLRFDTPGEQTVRVTGRSFPGDAVVEVRRTVTVQPAT